MTTTHHRMLPASKEAEMGVLGSILIDPQNILALCAERGVISDYFHSPSHATIFQALMRMWEERVEIDGVTLMDRLEAQRQLEAVGGAEYVANLCQYMPTAANIGRYIHILREKWQLREVIRVGTEAVMAGYDSQDEPEAVVEALEAGALAIRARTEHREAEPPKAGVMAAIGAIQDLYERKGKLTGISTGFDDLDDLTDGLHPGEMFVIAARPSVGKTTIGMNIAEHVAVEEKLPVGVFSLEMSKEQLWQRLLCSRARVNAAKVRNGFLAERDFPALTASASQLAESGLYIDDSSGLSIQALRGKARRMVQKWGIRAIFIDYLQLLRSSSRKSFGNREQEVSEISQGCKNLAKELGLPVMVLAQLNRSVESRSGNAKLRPRLSDLRESGCLSVSTTRLLTGDGVQCTLSSRMNTYSINPSGTIGVRSSRYLAKPDARMVRIFLRSGRFIDCTPSHPILTDRGYVSANKLTAEHSIAAVRKLDQPRGVVPVAEAKWIGWMLGNGSMIGNASPSFICSCDKVATAFQQETHALFGLHPHTHRHTCKKVFQYDITAGPVRTKNGNPCKDWLRLHDLWDRRAETKRIPDWFMSSADDASIAALVAGLWETDGCASRGKLSFSTTSNELAWQMMWCLARLGIFCYLDNGFLSDKANYPCFKIMISDGRDVLRFREAVPMIGRKAKILEAFRLSPSGSNHGDRLGLWVQREITNAVRAAGLSWKDAGYRVQGKRISKDDLARVIACVPGLQHLSHLTHPSIYWDQMQARHNISDGAVFDREVIGGPHNFVANGIIVHNSIEQDADTVGLLVREEYYADTDAAKEACAGQATLIIAKQRSGPVGDVPLTFIKELTRFETRARCTEEPARSWQE